MPLTDPVKLIGPAAIPAHNTWFAGTVTLGIGLRVIVEVAEELPQMPVVV